MGPLPLSYFSATKDFAWSFMYQNTRLKSQNAVHREQIRSSGYVSDLYWGIPASYIGQDTATLTDL